MALVLVITVILAAVLKLPVHLNTVHSGILFLVNDFLVLESNVP